jgi:predicted nucleic acid-binding protein
MTFADLPAGSVIFLDANTLIYHFTAHADFGRACSELLDRVERQEIQAITAAHLVSEVAHRLMTIDVYGWPFAGIARRLRRHWKEVQNLPKFRVAVDEVRKSRIQVHSVNVDLVAEATGVSQQFGLLSNDALLVAVMQHHSLRVTTATSTACRGSCVMRRNDSRLNDYKRHDGDESGGRSRCLVFKRRSAVTARRRRDWVWLESYASRGPGSWARGVAPATELFASQREQLESRFARPSVFRIGLGQELLDRGGVESGNGIAPVAAS